MQGLRPQMLLVLGCSEEDYDEVIRKATDEMGGDYKPYINWKCYTGRKADAKKT